MLGDGYGRHGSRRNTQLHNIEGTCETIWMLRRLVARSGEKEGSVRRRFRMRHQKSRFDRTTRRRRPVLRVGRKTPFPGACSVGLGLSALWRRSPKRRHLRLLRELCLVLRRPGDIVFCFFLNFTHPTLWPRLNWVGVAPPTRAATPSGRRS